MKPFGGCLLLALVFVFAAACSLTNGGATRSSNLDRIVQSGSLRVGMAADMPPLNMLHPSGVPMGLDVDLAEHLAAAMGVAFQPVVTPFPDLLPALQAEAVDMVISGVAITPQNNLQAAFVGPYHIAGKALLTQFDSAVTAEAIAALNSEAFAFSALAGSASAELVAAKLPRARLVPVAHYDEAVELVLANRVDALVADHHVCVWLLLQHPDAGLVSRITPLTYEPLGIALPPGDVHLINWVENVLDSMRESGQLIDLRDKWMRDASWLEDSQ